MYSLTQPILAETSAIEVAGTIAAAVEMTRAGTSFLVFIARVSPDCAKACGTASPLQHPCHERLAFKINRLRPNAPTPCGMNAPRWCRQRTMAEHEPARGQA